MSADAEPDRELVDECTGFLRRYYREEVLELADRYPSDQASLTVDWYDLFQYDADLADDWLEHPADIQQSLEAALAQQDVPIDVDLDGAHVWVENLPDASVYDVGEYRNEQVNQLIGIRGVVAKATDIEPAPEMVVFECQRCGTLTEVPQDGQDIQAPQECRGCERQGPFTINTGAIDFYDHRLIRVQAPPDRATGADAPTIDIHVEHDLVERVEPGDRVVVPAVLRAESRDDDIAFRLYGEAMGVEVRETDFEDVEVSQEDRERIEAVAEDEPFQTLIQSFCPSLYGYDHVKEAIILQMFGGQQKDPGDGSTERGQSHIALIGDPSTGKSTLLDYAAELAPRSVRSAGKTSSAAGITAAAVRDDFGPGGEWTLEGGAIVKADKGLAAIDELDSMDAEDREALNEALEHQRVSVSKAGINATLKARTTLLAAANPIHGRFDPYTAVAEQIDLDPTLLSRFDLIFTFSDKVDEERDEQIIDHKTTVWRVGAERANGGITHDADTVSPELEPDLIRKWIAHAKERVHPVPTENAIATVEEAFKELRQANADLEEDETPIPVTFRKQEAIHRLAEASARVRLSDHVEEQDVSRALRLIRTSLEQIGTDEEGTLDADVIETGVSMSQQKRLQTLEAVINDLEESTDGYGAKIEDVIDVMVEQEGVDRKTVEYDIHDDENGVLATGTCYQPQEGRIKWY